MSTMKKVLLGGTPVILLSLWAAWRPGKDHPDSPARVRGIFRFVNAAGRAYDATSDHALLALDPEDFAQDLAELKLAEHDLYGSPNTLSEFNGLSALFRGFESPGSLVSTMGRILIKRKLRSRLRRRWQILDYVKRHPEVLEVQIPRPLVIAGLPRTGSTFLQRLLAVDPRARAPHIWEMAADPNPRPPTEDEVVNMTDPRIQQVEKSLQKVRVIAPDYTEVVDVYHEVKATTVDEEVNLMRDCIWNNIGITYIGEDDSYQEWVVDENEDKTYMYRYIKVWVQIMSSTYQPKSHWILKTPSHSFFLPTLEKEFPDANLVFIHRDPTSVIASACKLNLVAGSSRIDFHKFDAARHGERVLRSLKQATDLIRSFHQNGSPLAQRAFHIRYEDLLADPIGTVEKLYAHCGYEMTDEFRDNMARHLAQNRQHKHGKPQYSLEQFGLDKAKVQEAFAEYNKTFRG